MTETPPDLGPASPFFIVGDLAVSLAYYTDVLGFECRLLVPEDAPFFAIVGRGAAQLLLKEIGPDAPPVPNHTRHEWASWDAFVHAADPDALAAEVRGRGAAFRTPLGDTEDDLRGFEIADRDGYVLFFGRPR